MKIFKKLLLIGSLTAPLFFSGHFQDTVAENFFKNFPEKISGAKTIEKYNTPGAKYCLVHIRQEHFVEELTEKELDKVDYIQKNIYEILNNLIEKRNLESVRVEGLFLRKSPKPNELEEAVINNYCKNYSETEKEYVRGGYGKLVLEGRIKPESTEYLEQRKKIDKKEKENGSSKNWKKTDLNSYIQYVLDEREDILLEIISSDNEYYSVTVYGGGHEWGGQKSCGKEYCKFDTLSNKDNIHEWNKKYPNKKFSLIEITPEGYSDDPLDWNIEIIKK